MAKNGDPTESIPCYIGRKACGCVVFALVDDPKDATDKKRQRENAKDIAKCIRDGLSIERRTVGYARENVAMCKCNQKQ